MIGTDFGAIMKINGDFVNKNRDKFMSFVGLNVPRYVWDVRDKTHRKKGESDRMEFIDNFYAYIGDGWLYGTWIAIYGTELYLIHRAYLLDVIDIETLDFDNDDEMCDATLNPKLPNVDSIYISRMGKEDSHRYYLSSRINDRHFEVILGKGISPKELEWESNKKKMNGYFTDDEIEEIDEWFAD